MVKDLVCGMEVSPETAKAKTEYQGKTYYFCSTHCKEKFEKQPEKYLQKKGPFGRFLDWLAYICGIERIEETKLFPKIPGEFSL